MKSLAEITIDSRLQLRDLAALEPVDHLALVDANRAYLRQWLPWLDNNVTAHDSAQFIARVQNENSNGQSLLLGIYFEGAPCGVVGFNTIDHAAHSAAIGYWLAEDRQGRGLLTRSLDPVVSYGFVNLGLQRVQLSAATENRKSRAVAERLGFTLESLCNEQEWLYDHYVGLAVYSMKKDDWAGAKLNDAQR